MSPFWTKVTNVISHVNYGVNSIIDKSYKLNDSQRDFGELSLKKLWDLGRSMLYTFFYIKFLIWYIEWWIDLQCLPYLRWTTLQLLYPLPPFWEKFTDWRTWWEILGSFLWKAMGPLRVDDIYYLWMEYINYRSNRYAVVIQSKQQYNLVPFAPILGKVYKREDLRRDFGL